jgi:oxepin-CoA hydrolase/3-oxo-5,6-dehydrosuberyl-CoA semialdehyde dehydrogenase
MHFDEIAAKESAFGQRIAHGYFVLSAAAGLFVSPRQGPVLANYGLDTCASSSRSASATRSAPASPASARSTAARRTRKGRGQGVVAWDVEVTNQADELVASYDILTLVAKRAEETA